jgi:hypothetical protein
MEIRPSSSPSWLTIRLNAPSGMTSSGCPGTVNPKISPIVTTSTASPCRRRSVAASTPPATATTTIVPSTTSSDVT